MNLETAAFAAIKTIFEMLNHIAIHTYYQRVDTDHLSNRIKDHHKYNPTWWGDPFLLYKDWSESGYLQDI